MVEEDLRASQSISEHLRASQSIPVGSQAPSGWALVFFQAQEAIFKAKEKEKKAADKALSWRATQFLQGGSLWQSD